MPGTELGTDPKLQASRIELRPTHESIAMVGPFPDPGRTAILVLGMHRSGTSAITRVISLLGADLPSNLMPAAKGNNEAGFWESMDAYRLNDEILASADSSWDDWRSLNPDWVRSPSMDQFKARALDMLERDFAQSSLFVLKDPRICRLLPFWIEILGAFGAKPKCVLPLRNPLEVAASLKTRDAFNPAKSQMLWLRHVVDAEYETRGLQRALLTFDQLLDDWRSAASELSRRFDLTWPRRSATAEVEIDRFLAHRHRHHHLDKESALEHAYVARWVKDAHLALDELRVAPECKEAQNRLDAVRSELNRASDALGPVLLSEEMARDDLAAASSARIGELENAAIERNARIADLEQTAAKHAARIGVLQRELGVEQDQKRAINRLKNEVLHRLDDLQTSAAGQLARPLYTLESRWPSIANRLTQFPKFVRSMLSLHPGHSKRVNRLANELQALGLFDRTWYVESNPDVVLGGQDPVFHWLARGWAEGRDPNPLFDINHYLETNSDVAVSGMNPLEHYLRSGAREGRKPHLMFDGDWYLARYPDVAEAGANPLAHYLSRGGEEGRDPHPLFDSGWYRTEHGDVAESGVDPFVHYLHSDAKHQRNPNPLFDSDWYRKHYPDVVASGMSPFEHYIGSGASEGRKPHPLFDGGWYLSRYPDVAEAGENPLAHFLRRGAEEKRDPHPLFDSGWYLQTNLDVAETGTNPLVHYLRLGAGPGRDPNPLFRTEWYLAQNPDLAASGINPLEHYVCSGASEERKPHPLFDGCWYLARYPDVAEAGENPLAHFLSKGTEERRDPHALFDSDWYLTVNRDVADSGANPLVHYLQSGAGERRDPNPLFDTGWYLKQNPDVAASGLNPLEHYLRFGAPKGRKPHPLFDGAWYLSRYPDVAEAGENPLAHFLRRGAKEKRDPHPLFDSGWYLAQDRDTAESGVNPLVHYLQSGAPERRGPNPLFDTDWYLEQIPDAADAGVNPLVHYLERGAANGIQPHPLFDSAWYAERYGDLAESGLSPLEHYLRTDASETRDPHPLFDSAWYLSQYRDVAESGANPLVHYLTRGASEGRNPNFLFDSAWYLERYPDVAKQNLNPLIHYVRWGAREGRKPGPMFDVSWYAAENPELQARGENPLAHYLRVGCERGQTCYPPFRWDRDWGAIVPITEPPHRVLVIDRRTPIPERDSGSYRVNKILTCLIDSGMEVDFIADQEMRAPEHVAQLERLGVGVRIGKASALYHLAKYGMAYKAVILVGPEVFFDYASIVRAFALNAKVIYDTADLHWIRFLPCTKVSADAKQDAARAESYKSLELASARSADVTVAVSEAEKTLLLREDPDLEVRVVPNIHEVASGFPPFSERKNLLFLGDFSYGPNVDAVHFFASRILQVVTDELPAIQLKIVGTNMTEDIRALASANVEPIGYAEDLERYLQQSRIFVCPLRDGAGSKGQIAESLRFGLPVVTTVIGAQGIGLVDGDNALVTDNADDFAASVVRLYKDEDLWSRLSDAGRDLIRRSYSNAAFCERMHSLLKQ